METGPDDDDRTIDPRRVRIGLALVGVVVAVAVVMFFVVEAPAGKALMFAIAVTAFIRLFLLARSVRRGEAT